MLSAKLRVQLRLITDSPFSYLSLYLVTYTSSWPFIFTDDHNVQRRASLFLLLSFSAASSSHSVCFSGLCIQASFLLSLISFIPKNPLTPLCKSSPKLVITETEDQRHCDPLFNPQFILKGIPSLGGYFQSFPFQRLNVRNPFSKKKRGKK